MSWRGGIKRDKTDIVFSYLVRERVNFMCEACRISFRHDQGNLHCSHIFGRRRQGARIHPLNGVAHCLNCHQRFGENPLEFAEWARAKLGDEKYDHLRFIANRPTKLTKWDVEIIHKHYLAEQKRMKALRAEGYQGRIDFKWPEAA